MFFDSSEHLTQTQNKMTGIDFQRAASSYLPTIGESIGASTAMAFDRSFGVRIYENISQLRKEREALAAGTTYKFNDEADFKTSDYYRPGVEFTPGMTAERARLNAIEYDKRRSREWILQGADQNGSSWLYMPVNFAAGMIGSLPDPINFVPGVLGFGVAAKTIKGAELAGLTGRQMMKRSLTLGVAAEAAGTNLASSAYAAWDLNPKGEHITMQDVLTDAAMGAFLGPLFHTGGMALSRRKARGAIRNTYSELQALHPEGDELAKAVEAMKHDDPEAYKQYGNKLEQAARAYGNQRDAVDFFRTRVDKETKMEISRYLEHALMQVADGQIVDLAPIAQGSPTMLKIQNLINEYKGETQEKPVVVDTVESAKGSIAALEKEFASLEKQYQQAVHFVTPELRGLSETKARMTQVIDNVKATFKELTDLQEAKDTTTADIVRFQRQLGEARIDQQQFASLFAVPDSMRTGVDLFARMEKVIADTEAKLAEINTEIDRHLGANQPADVTRLNWDTVKEVPQEEFVPRAPRTRTQEVVEDAGLNRETGLSDTEMRLGQLSEEEFDYMRSYTEEGIRINEKERLALEDTPLVECVMGVLI